MAQKRRRGRPKGVRFSKRLQVRYEPDDYALVQAAAGPYPVATWIRVETVRLARERLGIEAPVPRIKGARPKRTR